MDGRQIIETFLKRLEEGHEKTDNRITQMWTDQAKLDAIAAIDAELAQLQAKCDSLAAENRLIAATLSDLGHCTEAPRDCICALCAKHENMRRSACASADTNREIARVKALEAVAVATREIPDHVWAYPQMDALRAALDKLKGGDK